ncbi:tRNA pseudouridine(38-40) synthase TruA [Plasticicumulans acidivorans]|uniref:tRNA pseudouridine synthase A n=1 Tax=Plasticicumulans acidivorans TaxID=886464 RepID=A0A317MSV6_9GAMM|nr:tRNA pseudouridine(38-40) synthase TruA [Plasticicumulans acidivorans]PWV60234.1 tRNA pseudouridine(38-40) synthase [Plasticicumulans acidivorans]
MRIALGIEYDGSRFRGWQTQEPGVRTVQEALETAVSRIAAQPVGVVCAGRTDAGVHAAGQVVHFDTSARRDLHAWVMGSNSQLPDDVSVSWAREVADDFHARFSAYARRYRYLVLNRCYRSALCGGRMTHWYAPLDAERMHAAGQALLGEHDFSAYRAAGCQAEHPMRALYELSVRRRGDFVVLEVEANAFLHHMVRNIAGVLLAIGSGERPPEWAAEVLATRDRRRGGVTAPADGLYFLEVLYPERFALPRGNPSALPVLA